MRPTHQLPLMGLLLFSLIPSQLCKICEVNERVHFHLDPLLDTMIQPKYTSVTQTASVLLSLRLVGIQNQNQTILKEFSQQVRNTVERRGLDLSSGQLAMVILALGACHTHDESFIFNQHLLSHLENKFKAELENMEEHNGNPLTNYYQLSLDILTLCLFNRTYSTATVAKLFAPENKNYYLGGQFSVDTGAMAVLALTCVSRSLKEQPKAQEENLQRIDNHIRSLVKKILSEKKENGLIGNTFSTGAAMQALFVSSKYYSESEWNCQETRNTILNEISQGAFNIPAAAAQILPALLGKTYLDVTKDSPCNSPISIPVPPPVTTSSPSLISVHYSVKIDQTYSINVRVPSGSVFLDVMKEAQKENRTLFRFTVEQSEWGPYITSVQGLNANNNDRTYWELLSGGKPLSQGVGSYVVHNGDNLEVLWSKY
ncbi:transcobalamin-1 [Perognathus longimembris pacificus]|uniref:transcobalamin-1 n=1 Tax=Perognathus longimembris pacificus TaxID=214514 RepID=UPI00201889BA|nr:transcobalamin-1 [Perognathus longimembris pacificus]